MIASRRCKLALACLPLILAACGGDVMLTKTTTTAPAPVPGTGTGTADTTSPWVVLTTVGNSSGILYLEATANDNVQVTAVRFKIDGLDVGSSQHNNDGTWLTELDASHVPAGPHVVTAVAFDAAGNSGEGQTSLVMAPPSLAAPDATPPVVTAAVDGGFGLVKLTAIATDDVKVSTVVFYVDGKPTDTYAGQSFMGTDPVDQYFQVIDTTDLADGPHRVFARVEDTSGNQTDSAAVVMNVDHAAGLVESEPNDTIATANVLADGQTLVSGAMRGVPGKPDVDFYKFSLDGDKVLSVEMLSETIQGFQVQLVDANGAALGTPQYMSASDVNTVTCANGATRRDVYIQVTSLDADFTGREQYRLTLFVH